MDRLIFLQASKLDMEDKLFIKTRKLLSCQIFLTEMKKLDLLRKRKIFRAKYHLEAKNNSLVLLKMMIIKRFSNNLRKLFMNNRKKEIY